MTYLILAAIAAFLSFPQMAYEQKPPESPPAVEESAIPEIMAKIAECESQSRQFNENGKVLKGGYNHHDIGKYQINDLYWGDFAKELGLNIYSEKDNEVLALAIYEKYGTDPWNSSKKCWSK